MLTTSNATGLASALRALAHQTRRFLEGTASVPVPCALLLQIDRSHERTHSRHPNELTHWTEELHHQVVASHRARGRG